jgi:RNA polymerase sigma factor (sigma-70 family)
MPEEEKPDIILLWDAFMHGDDKAFVRIYYFFIELLLSYGRKLTRNRELLYDSVQEVFMDIYQKRGKPHISIGNLKSYLFISLRNSILKKMMHDRKFDAVEQEVKKTGEFQVEYSFEDQWISNEISEGTRNKLQQAVQNLSPGQKEIIYLKFEEGLGYPEISEMLGITQESARKQLYRAMLSLRHIIGNEHVLIFYTLFLKNVSKNCPRSRSFPTI